MTGVLLSVEKLNVCYQTPRGVSKALREVSIEIPDNSIVGIVGESGSGKSTLAFALMGLLPANADMDVAGIVLDGENVADDLASQRGRAVSMVFQDPMSGLNPFFRISTQMIDAQRRRFPNASRRELRERALEALKRVGINAPEERLNAYPHQLSGGMRQRTMIAMALLVEPRLLIADEPTTALDATVEAEIVELLSKISAGLDGSVLMVSHSLGMVASLCHRVVVMYGGVVVESGDTASVFGDPRHPYTRALLGCEIDPWEDWNADAELATIDGVVPELIHPPAGCIFRDRCPQAFDKCTQQPPNRERPGEGTALCWLA